MGASHVTHTCRMISNIQGIVYLEMERDPKRHFMVSVWDDLPAASFENRN